MMKAVNETSQPRWWERIIVAVLFAAAAACACAAQQVSGESNKSNQSKTLQAVARLYMSNGDYGKAEQFANKALNAAVKKEGANTAAQEDTSSCLIDLVWVYKNQGRLLEAEKTCLLGLKLQQQTYYKDHPYIAYTLRILGSIYQAQGRYSAACEAFDRAMAIIRKCHTADDPVTASFEVDIARLLVAEGRFDEAEEIYERSLRLISNYYGVDHLYTAGVLSDVAKLYYLEGRYEEAQQLLRYAMSIQQQVFGEGHRMLIPNQLTMARIYQARGEIKRAEQLLTDALAAAQEPPSYYEPLKGEIYTVLAEIYLNSGRYAAAQIACGKAINILRESVGLDSEITAMALNCQVRLYVLEGKYNEAYELGCRILASLETAHLPSHPSVITVNETVGMTQEVKTVAQVVKANALIR
jgi:tetratricopeptide (TPR) repeat protein